MIVNMACVLPYRQYAALAPFGSVCEDSLRRWGFKTATPLFYVRLRPKAQLFVTPFRLIFPSSAKSFIPCAMLITLHLNGVSQSLALEPQDLLVTVLRDQLGLTGTHMGCETSQCGACTVLLNGCAVKSCTILAVQAEGASLTTIEGVASPTGLHPMQEAFRDHHGLQCGFCTPGMVMLALDIVRRRGTRLDPNDVAHDLEGNLCRCTGYQNIIAAIVAGARRMEDMGS